jgi:hypothetical protein
MQELPTGQFHDDPPDQAIDRLSNWQSIRKGGYVRRRSAQLAAAQESAFAAMR